MHVIGGALFFEKTRFHREAEDNLGNGCFFMASDYRVEHFRDKLQFGNS